MKAPDINAALDATIAALEALLVQGADPDTINRAAADLAGVRAEVESLPTDVLVAGAWR